MPDIYLAFAAVILVVTFSLAINVGRLLRRIETLEDELIAEIESNIEAQERVSDALKAQNKINHDVFDADQELFTVVMALFPLNAQVATLAADVATLQQTVASLAAKVSR